MKYIKTFDAHSEYLDFKESDEMVYPNILVCREEEHVHVDFPEAPIVPLTFIAASAPGHIGKLRTESEYAAVIKLMDMDNSQNYNFFYSINDGDWEECEYIQYDSQTTAGTVNGFFIVLENVGDYVRLKGVLNEYPEAEKGVLNRYPENDGSYTLNGYQFSIDGYARAEGDITSLVNGVGGDCALDRSAFAELFAYCDGLLSAPNLPSTNIERYCYYSMFQGCTNLVSGPQILPATELAEYCYYYMFKGCTSLTSAPELPAPILEHGCYQYMFEYCSSLAYIKALFLTNPEEQLNEAAKSSSYPYTSYWTNGVSNSGFFEGNPDATWCCRGINGIPANWDTNMSCLPFIVDNPVY